LTLLCSIICLFLHCYFLSFFFFFQAEDGIRDFHVTGVQTCALPISRRSSAGIWCRCSTGTDAAHGRQRQIREGPRTAAQITPQARRAPPPPSGSGWSAWLSPPAWIISARPLI